MWLLEFYLFSFISFHSFFHKLLYFFQEASFQKHQIAFSKCCTKSDRIQSIVVPSTYYWTSHPLSSSWHQCHKWGLACHCSVLKWDRGWVRQAWLITASRITWMTESPDRSVSKLWTQPICSDYFQNQRKWLKKQEVSQLGKGSLTFKWEH